MPGDDADFAAYLGARWPSLVRTLVLLGCGRRDAEQVARTGLAKCYTAWERVRRGDDVDTYVYGAVLDSLRKQRRRATGTTAEPAPEPAPAEEPTDAVLLRRDLEAQLDRLSPEEREVLVLRFVADLSAAQVAAVLDASLETVRTRTAQALSGIDLDGLRDAHR